ncbi:hypothetical protein AAKU55_004810 [Oxalobacteraceae bacterium GrIS 1.11]
MFESLGQRLLLWGDIVHAAEVQLRHPGITIDYDVERDAALASRARILTDAQQQGCLVGGAHRSFPGLGRVRAELSGFSWIAAPASVMLQDAPGK